MEKITLIATLSFGLEAVVKRELQTLGFMNIKASDGKVEFEATPEDIPRANSVGSGSESPSASVRAIGGPRFFNTRPAEKFLVLP